MIFIAFIIGLAVTAVMIKSFNAASMHAEQDERTVVALAQAKEALIAWAVTYSDLPGMLPYPDRGTDVGGYDGGSDCFASNVNFNHQFLIGQLPTKFSSDTNCIALARQGLPQFQDGSGNRLWYAVSRNLVRNYQSPAINPVINPVINPGVINIDNLKPKPYDGTVASSAYPWLVVLDRNGEIISNRVAVVLVAPGVPIGNQNRSKSGTSEPAAKEFLDDYVVNGSTFSNHNYSQDNEDFIVVDTSSPTFNDRLVFITIDELMYALEKRALMEAKAALNSYFAVNGHYPFAAGLGSKNPNQCVQGNLRGLLPTEAPLPQSCTCTALDTTNNIPSTCDCNFSIVSSIKFQRSAGLFVATGASENAPFGNCSVSPTDMTICDCNGAGGCKTASGATEFSCNACGVCTSVIEGKTIFSTSGSLDTSTGSCDISAASEAECENDEAREFSLVKCDSNAEIRTQLPEWFLKNRWQDYIHYEVSSNCTVGKNCITPTLTVGEKSNAGAVLATVGADILTAPFALSKGAKQERPSCDIRDYLDSVENTNVVMANGFQDMFYQPTQRRTSSMNDQIEIVGP